MKKMTRNLAVIYLLGDEPGRARGLAGPPAWDGNADALLSVRWIKAGVPYVRNATRRRHVHREMPRDA